MESVLSLDFAENRIGGGIGGGASKRRYFQRRLPP
jgi:hypothetical protein